MNNAPPSKEPVSSFEIVIFLCNHFAGLSPFEVKKRDFREVLELYVQLSVSLNKTQNKGKYEAKKGTWVTSKTASWH